MSLREPKVALTHCTATGPVCRSFCPDCSKAVCNVPSLGLRNLVPQCEQISTFARIDVSELKEAMKLMGEVRIVP